jgi:L-amino acid N-acyltransferase YncA
MIRPVKTEDAESIAAIYNEYVLNTDISFETDAVTTEEMRLRISEISTKFPYFVYEIDGKVVGYSYAHLWKSRAAYRHTLETTIYIATNYQGQGIGRKLMEKLIESCKHQGYKVLIACITEDNLKSCIMHENLGFKQVSHFEKVGCKFGRWLGVRDFELIL